MTQENRDAKPVSRSAEFVAAAAAIAAGTSSYADVVRYDNLPPGSGYFDWPFAVLDITLPAEDQPGTLGAPTTSYQNYFGDFYPTFSYQHTYQSGGGMRIFSQGFNDRYAAPLDAGTMIGPDLANDGTFTAAATFEFAFTACDIYYVGYPCYCYYYDCEDGTRGLIPEGVETYLGVRFTQTGGDRFGWVKIIRQGAYVEALAWGFETEPGVPIAAGAGGGGCPADIDGDGQVAITDLLAILTNWGTDGPGADIAKPLDVVNIADLIALLSQWGPCEPGARGVPPAGTLAALATGSSAH